jgi:hypothetical protein
MLATSVGPLAWLRASTNRTQIARREIEKPPNRFLT